MAGRRVAPRHGWAALFTLGLLLEIYGLRRDNTATFSQLTRDLFHTHTRTGRIAFTVGLYVLFRWYHPHILKELTR